MRSASVVDDGRRLEPRALTTTMSESAKREPARDPLDLERLLVARQRAGDVDGMVALFESDAVIDPGDRPWIAGSDAIRRYFTELVSAGEVFAVGDQRPAMISGDIALTSTRFPNGSISTEVARRQADGTWLWIIDRYAVR